MVLGALLWLAALLGILVAVSYAGIERALQSSSGGPDGSSRGSAREPADGRGDRSGGDPVDDDDTWERGTGIDRDSSRDRREE